MRKLTIQFGLVGGGLGMLAGLIELSIGSQIRPWIGNKEQPAVLGLVTLLLSGMAVGAIVLARTLKHPENDHRLAIFLGVCLPALICFTTVGRLWYAPGVFLAAASVLLAAEYWLRPSLARQADRAPGMSPASRMGAAIGSLLILAGVGLGFWISAFGLFRAELLVNAQPIRLEILPMDFVRLTTVVADTTTLTNTEVQLVMFVYLLLIVTNRLIQIQRCCSSEETGGPGEKYARRKQKCHSVPGGLRLKSSPPFSVEGSSYDP
jgi:hypothetical protein